MARKKKYNDDEVELIPKSQRIAELEELVDFYMKTTPSFPENKTLFKRVQTPKSFKDASERVAYWREEINRCKTGYKGMCGKMYFFYNYVYMQNLKGKIRPEYRVCDNEWFKLVTECQNSNKYGIVCVKRRRVGASWKEAADAVQDLMFQKFYYIGINSKSERDSILLFKKIMFIYENLPPEMKAAIGAKSGMHVEFFRWDKDEMNNKIKKGNQCDLIVVPPTDSAYEGMMLNKWICDEAGKINNLTQIWSYTEDCLMQETVRVGIPILFGTSGDITKNGQGLMEKWDKADVYNLKRFFFAGWNGLAVDKYGNDRKEDCIRWIVYKRREKEELDKKQYVDFVQKYPLTPEEAFSKYSAEGLGDPVRLNNHARDLKTNPPVESRGRFAILKDEDWEIKWIPEKFGPVRIFEHPTDNPNDSYVIGVDPADHDNATDTDSELSLHVLKEGNGIEPLRMVCEFVDRPRALSEYYDQSIAIALYYNKAKMLIEDNRYRMISHLDNLGFKDLLHYSPPNLKRLYRTRPNSLGIRMTPDVKEFLEGVYEDYLEKYTELIPSVELIEETREYGTRNTDRVMSFGIALILARSREKRIKKNYFHTDRKKLAPTFSYQRVGGVIKRLG